MPIILLVDDSEVDRQLMAGLLANTIENTRLFRQTQETLKEVEAFQRLRVHDAWSRHISRQE